ncbi:MAG: hypothetical protein E7Z84_03080 [Methanosphaera stadtmanae]|nr:hypothetical protein [Methanosphaera stadtmanae]
MDKQWQNLAEYIIKNFSNSTKIVEVGVGKILEPSEILREKLPDTEIITIDLYPANETVIQDDITNPNPTLYQNADLIYSIRPPEELQHYIIQLSKQFDTNVLIKPLFTEEINVNLQPRLKLVNYKKMAFYINK